jgi:hypothetical protein
LGEGGMLVCVHCGAERGKLPDLASKFVGEVIKQFGELDAPVALRKGTAAPRAKDAAADEVTSRKTEQCKQIDQQ